VFILPGISISVLTSVEWIEDLKNENSSASLEKFPFRRVSSATPAKNFRRLSNQVSIPFDQKLIDNGQGDYPLFEELSTQSLEEFSALTEE
jgi:hypothetical protein